MEAKQPTAFEQAVLREIHAWKTRRLGLMGKAVKKVNDSLQEVTDLALQVPGAQWTIDNVLAGLLRLVNELAQDTLWREAIYADYRKRGYAVYSTKDIRTLSLRTVNRALKSLDIKYRSVTAAQGVAAGIAGGAGVIPDVVGLVALNLRAVGEYATYCGFDMARDHERSFALQILHAQAQQEGEERNEEGLVPVSAVSQALANRHAKQTVQQVAVSTSMGSVIRALGKRLTAFKLAQGIPMAGALIGGGTNALYTTRVCTAALHLYRERRLLEKYPHITLQQFRDA